MTPAIAADPAADLRRALTNREPLVWPNPRRQPAAAALSNAAVTPHDLEEAEARWRRFAPLLEWLFPELAPARGRIDSPLEPVAEPLARAILGRAPGRLLVKADDRLPLTGSVKARGGIFEVLCHAEAVALGAGLVIPDADYRALAEAPARRLFAAHTIVVGSTGNLGYSVGLMARALGFSAEIHMSHDAKAWKKERLRRIGATVVEHRGDYSAAVASARLAAAADPWRYFVDDEDSIRLFLGYACAAGDLARQLADLGIAVGPGRPLVVYLPCGVGGAPGGIAFGLKSLFGDDCLAVFVEPVEAPSMLVQLASGLDRSVSVAEFGLSGRTEADGLAVAAASMLVARTAGGLIDACVTETDVAMRGWAVRAWREGGLKLEVSAASALAAARRIASSGLLADRIGRAATHVLWTTGGAQVPQAEFEAMLDRCEADVRGSAG